MSYYNGSSYTFTWTVGRRLATAVKGSTSLSFTYNENGIRTYKKVCDNLIGETFIHEYILNGSQIIGEAVYCVADDYEPEERYRIVYIYDETGSPIGMKYREPSYAAGVYDCFFFEKNLQGDIIAVYNATGTKLLTYDYDAWGNCTESDASQFSARGANYNPFRYRGYYYDRETGWYYLQSRYYNPEWGRFLNSDYISMLGANKDFESFNLFVYCGNNPIMRIDTSGCGWESIIDCLKDAFQIISEVFSYVATSRIGTASRMKTSTYLGGGIYRTIPSALSASLVASGNRLSAVSKVTKTISKSLGYVSWVFIGIDIGVSIGNNILNEDLSTSRKVSDTIVDIGVAFGSVGISAGVGAFIGSFIPLPGIGTAAGLVVGLGIGYIAEATPVVDWIKESTDWAVNKVGTFFKNLFKKE